MRRYSALVGSKGVDQAVMWCGATVILSGPFAHGEGDFLAGSVTYVRQGWNKPSSGGETTTH